jgi:hypothetical protein
MKVFTQRIVFNLLTDYNSTTPTDFWTPTTGVHPEWDEFLADFDSKYPGAFPRTVNPLDYCITLDPPVYVIGKYWGGEESLSIATEWVTARTAKGWAPTTLITCDDNQHPTELPLVEILSPESVPYVEMYLKTGHYLASDPGTFVSAT